MAAAIDELVQEHRRIEEILASLETFLSVLGSQPYGERDAIRGYVRFFRGLVDTCHHGKEEGYLFVKMSAYGFSRESGPVSAMLSEHDEGKDHLDALTLIGEGAGPLSSEEMEVLRGHALGYILRIRPHIMREEDILFPMAVHSLPDFVLDELAVDFAEFERTGLPAGFHRELREISRSLTASYPPKVPA